MRKKTVKSKLTRRVKPKVAGGRNVAKTTKVRVIRPHSEGVPPLFLHPSRVLNVFSRSGGLRYAATTGYCLPAFQAEVRSSQFNIQISDRDGPRNAQIGRAPAQILSRRRVLDSLVHKDLTTAECFRASSVGWCLAYFRAAKARESALALSVQAR